MWENQTKRLSMMTLRLQWDWIGKDGVGDRGGERSNAMFVDKQGDLTFTDVHLQVTFGEE